MDELHSNGSCCLVQGSSTGGAATTKDRLVVQQLRPQLDPAVAATRQAAQWWPPYQLSRAGGLVSLLASLAQVKVIVGRQGVVRGPLLPVCGLSWQRGRGFVLRVSNIICLEYYSPMSFLHAFPTPLSSSPLLCHHTITSPAFKHPFKCLLQPFLDLHRFRTLLLPVSY